MNYKMLDNDSLCCFRDSYMGLIRGTINDLNEQIDDFECPELRADNIEAINMLRAELTTIKNNSTWSL